MTAQRRALVVELVFSREGESVEPERFELEPATYSVRTGRLEKRFRVEWSPTMMSEISEVYLDEEDATGRLGRTLRGYLQGEWWTRREQEIAAALAEQRPVRVTIVSGAHELYALPWEVLRLNNKELGATPGVLIHYERPEVIASAGSGARERLLIACSDAGGAVGAREHISALARAFAEAGQEFDEARASLTGATLGALVERLEHASREGAPITTLHVLCHGGAESSEAGKRFGLQLGSSAQPELVSAEELARAFAPYSATLRLVVLCACRSGHVDARDRYAASVAQRLHELGIAAVVAPRFPLSVQGAETLAREFFPELLATGDVARAFLRTRRAFFNDSTAHDWVSLQLHALSEVAARWRWGGARPVALDTGADPLVLAARKRFMVVTALAALLVVAGGVVVLALSC